MIPSAPTPTLDSKRLRPFATGTSHDVPRYESWRAALRDAVRSVGELCQILELPNKFLQTLVGKNSKTAADSIIGADFPLLVPRSFVARMERGNPADPLLAQVLPTSSESHNIPDFTHDPVGDLDSELQNGLLHKYEGRALLVMTGACAVHCRYCFRRHFPYHEVPHRLVDWMPVIEMIENDESINEVILSGGDPLTLRDEQLAELVQRFAAIPHLRRLRVHSRLPIVLPDRVGPEMLSWLTGSRLAPVMVVHANHPAELVGDCAEALQKLVKSGIPTLNQAVLLRGINDSAAVLKELSERLVDLGVMPYYLHQLDRVSGAAHFEVPVEEGLRIVEQLRTELPGYAVPKYVQEIAGAASKVPLTHL